MKNLIKYIKDSIFSSDYDKAIASTMFSGGCFANIAGLIMSMIFKDGKMWVPTAISFVILISLGTVCFLKKAYSAFNIIACSLYTFLVFPTLFLVNGGVHSSFIFYAFIGPICWALTVKRFWHLIFLAISIFIMCASIAFSIAHPEIIKDTSEVGVAGQWIAGYSISNIFVFIAVFASFNKVVSDKKTLEIAEALLKDKAEKDELTSIFNRHKLDADMYVKPWKYVAITDIDNFKKVNDNYGHIAGDYALKDLAVLFKNNCEETFRVYRYGGEEFVILSNLSLEDTIKRLEQVYDAAHRHLKIHNQEEKNITFCTGISCKTNNSFEQSLVKADEAMYMAKKNGKDQCWMYDGKDFTKVISH